MNVRLNYINGFEDAFTGIYTSKLTDPKTGEMRDLQKLSSKHQCLCDTVLNRNGFMKRDKITNRNISYNEWNVNCEIDKFNDLLNLVVKIGKKHITLLRFINLSFTVTGMHRGGQDDIDSHSKRMDNRILRSSTRLSDTSKVEMSDYYKDKILTLDQVIKIQDITLPETITHDGDEYVRVQNGYVKTEYAKNKDVLRGLCMLGMESNFIMNINLTEFAHIVKERDKNSNANPEVKECIEKMISLVEKQYPVFNRELYYEIIN